MDKLMELRLQEKADLITASKILKNKGLNIRYFINSTNYYEYNMSIHGSLDFKHLLATEFNLLKEVFGRYGK